MLHVFFGNNTSEVRQNALSCAHSFEESDNQITHIMSDTYGIGSLPDLSQSVSLFLHSQVFILDMLSERSEAYEDMLTNLELLEKSEHNFILIEGGVTAAVKKKFSAHGACHESIALKEESFNTFSLTDALLLRDKKTLWLRLMEAMRAGVPAEEIIGVLFWQIKILRLVGKTKSAEEAGQKPFVYDKAKRALSKFKDGELEKLSRELIILYHEGHMGKADINLALEKWVLMI